jgi:hypothetical protein
MSTHDITVGTASRSWDGSAMITTLHQRLTSTVADPFVTGDTYQLWHIPAGCICFYGWYVVRTTDAGTGTITLNAVSTAGTVPMLTTQAVSGAAGTAILPANTLVGKWFEVAGTIDVVIGTANLTTSVVDVFVMIIDSTVRADAALDHIHASSTPTA